MGKLKELEEISCYNIIENSYLFKIIKIELESDIVYT